jgi:hypothetical protein
MESIHVPDTGILQRIKFMFRRWLFWGSLAAGIIMAWVFLFAEKMFLPAVLRSESMESPFFLSLVPIFLFALGLLSMREGRSRKSVGKQIQIS